MFQDIFFPTYSYIFFHWKIFQIHLQDYRFFIPPISALSLTIHSKTSKSLFLFPRFVRDVRLVIVKNVFGTCADKMDADCGIDLINVMLKSNQLIPYYLATCISLTAHFMTDAISPFFRYTLPLTNTLSLSVSLLSCSLPLHLRLI